MGFLKEAKLLIIANVSKDDDAPSLKYRASLIANTEGNGKKRVKIAVPPKYLNNLLWSLEKPLINCKVEVSLQWI